MDFLIEEIKRDPSFKEIVKNIKTDSFPLELNGINESATSLFTSAIKDQISKKIVVIARDRLSARKIYDDLKSLTSYNVELYPEKDLFLYDRDSKSKENLKQRLKALKLAAEDQLDICICTLRSLRDRISSKEKFKSYSIDLNVGQKVDFDELIEKLMIMGYERYPIVEGLGQFSVRGSIFDIATGSENYRIELFDDEIDSIRTFDISNQRSIEVFKAAKIFSINDIILEDGLRAEVAEAIEADLNDETSAKKSRLFEKFSKHIDILRHGGHIANMDLLIPYLRDLKNITDYFEEAVYILSEPSLILEREEAIDQEQSENFVEMREFGEVLNSHKNMLIDLNDIILDLGNQDTIYFCALINTPKEFKRPKVIDCRINSNPDYMRKIKYFREDLSKKLNEGYRAILFGGSEKRSRRLFDLMVDMNFSPALKLSRNEDISEENLIITPGSLEMGFTLLDIKLIFINYSQIYGSNKKTPKPKKKKSLNFEDLKLGDYVVHESHGIGKYIGTNTLEIQNVKKDYIVIEYRGDDKLFLPIESLDMIYKYMGDEKIPKVNKLNSQEWKKTKQKAKKSIDDMAEDLIKLYAKRQELKGFRFSKDSQWQKEFEDAFIYEETEGQLISTSEIKRDMQSQRPMDRLLCADVGYGKTEVALRAAFKAVLDGKQVAFLVPTTILAQQHFNTMIERFADFPVEVALLTRFRTAKEQKEDLKRLKQGMVDIVVGTHRILSKDVEFKDLGLLIIDEEQRFGVRHKEKLKMLKQNVDTLTLTATPIPRTLQMSMIGIRDMSVIDEPPEDRFPIQTYVLEYNPLMVREAITREIERGGQIYFLYNDVMNMSSKLRELRQLVPEARIEMANGQMSQVKLESTMMEFLNGDIDVLLCSTIIETGMDVQNANTLIVTNANKLGLSQLYQLRGRIGRTNRVAYAYFTYEKDSSITEIAQKRLKAIKEFTDFGSGYKIAMRDLELRGSGSILGGKQSGHIENIGYDLYLKYLKDAISKLKGEKTEEKLETTLDLRLDSYIPPNYIEDEMLRLQMYKKISVIEDDEDYFELCDELIDRFSNMPREVLNLMEIALMKSKAQKAGIESIVQKNNSYIFKLAGEHSLDLVKDLSDYELKFKSQNSFEISKISFEDLKKIISFVSANKL